MTAGTVVITGGILATVILLCIIVVLCYCRLQYYCCKKNGSDPDSASCSQAQLACDSCSPPRLDGASVAPLSLSARSFCPTCSPYSSSYYIRTTDETRNGAERIGYMPGQHESPSLSFALPSTHSTSLSSHTLPEFYSNTRAISTDV
ncbi:protein FAM163A [Hoplias malabaricus]|uniref:protein FAM163A n=1 Tax=Hoplias malabaricus TaxID=27720 RepID=UPI00346308E0